MAVSSEVARVVHTANGVATFFSFSPIDGVTSINLKVYLFNPTTGVLSLQTLGTDYTFGGGGVTFNTAPPSGRRVILFRQVSLLQPDIYKTNTPFPAVITENRFDEIVKGMQQINDVVQNRAIVLPIGEAGFSANTLPSVENRKGRVLYFNDTTGDPEAKSILGVSTYVQPWADSFLAQPSASAGLAYIGAVAKAGDTMTGFLTLNADPTSAMHAATKQYVDNVSSSANYVLKSGDTMTGLLTLSGAPTAANHAATKSYVDTADNAKVNKSGDTMTGFLTLNADPTSAMHAATKQYVDNASFSGNYVLKSGDTMTGFLTLNADPTSAMHAATKQYVDNASFSGNYVLKSGDTMTGDLTISKSTPVLQLNSSTVTVRGLQFSTNGSLRWQFFATSDAESGSNTGTQLSLNRYTDSGVYTGTVFTIDRSYGRFTFSGGVLPRVPAIDPTDNNDIVRKAYADYMAPPGAVMAFARSSVPTGWLKCNGAAVSRTTYANLFAAIGTTYGAGDGSTTFNLPDLRGEFIRGYDDGRGVDSGRGFGTAQTDAFQGHYHSPLSPMTMFVGESSASNTSPVTGSGYTNSVSTSTTGNPASNGTHGTPRTAAETRPRNVAMMYCIKY
jgi:microcystin-dependent protein